MYPTKKEVFRRVINQDLGEGQPGSTLDQGDHNLPADFLERLQDTLGLRVNGAFSSVANRILSLETLLPFKKMGILHWGAMGYGPTGMAKVYRDTGYNFGEGDTVFVIGVMRCWAYDIPHWRESELWITMGVTTLRIGEQVVSESIQKAGRYNVLLGGIMEYSTYAGLMKIAISIKSASAGGDIDSADLLYFVI